MAAANEKRLSGEKKGSAASGEIEAPSSITLDQRNTRSFTTACLHFLVRPLRPRLVKPPTKRKEVVEGSGKLDKPAALLDKASFKEVRVADIYIYEIGARLPPGITYRPKHDLYYFAGGSYVMGPSIDHWKFCVELANQLPEYQIHVVSAPLSPKNRASTALPMLYKLVDELCAKAEKHNRNISFAGDSSGGNLAIAVALHAARQALNTERRTTKLRNVFLISPSVDLRRENTELTPTQKKDPVQTLAYSQWCAKQWVDESMGADDPAVSPVLADLAPFRTLGIKVHGVNGSYDILAPTASTFRHMLETYGVKGEWLEWEKQMHCFPLAWHYGILPESTKSKDWILDVLRRNA